MTWALLDYLGNIFGSKSKTDTTKHKNSDLNEINLVVNTKLTQKTNTTDGTEKKRTNRNPNKRVKNVQLTGGNNTTVSNATEVDKTKQKTVNRTNKSSGKNDKSTLRKADIS